MITTKSQLILIALAAGLCSPLIAEVCDEYEDGLICGNPYNASCPDCVGSTCDGTMSWNCAVDTEGRYTGEKDCQNFATSEYVCHYYTQECQGDGGTFTNQVTQAYNNETECF